MIIHKSKGNTLEEMIEVNYGTKELLTRKEFERRLRNGTLPISVDDGVYKVIKR